MNETPLFRSRAGLAVILVAGLLLVLGLTQSANQPTPTDGPEGSSYATHGGGTAALVDLLEANGYDVARERRPLEEKPPAADDVVVIVNGAGLSPGDREAVVDHITGGARLVAVGSTGLRGLTTTSPDNRELTSGPSTAVLPLLGFEDVEQVQSSQVWPDSGSLLPLVANEDGIAVGVEYLGDGVIIAIADDRVISNQLLDAGDHALLALLAIGEPRGAVRFVEYIHGFTQPTGLAALPARWKQALVILAIAGLVWLASRGLRFGPAEETSRGLAPPRAAYLDALALTLEDSKDSAAVAPLDEAIRAALARRGADVGSSASMMETAMKGGLDEGLARRAIDGGRDEAGAKALLLSQLVNKEQL